MPPLAPEDGRPPLHPSYSPVNSRPAGGSLSPSSRGRQSFKFEEESSTQPNPLFMEDRSVRFSPIPFLIQIPHISDMSREEVDEMWYDETELDFFRAQAVDSAKRLSRRTLRFNECARGVEQLTPQGIESKTIARAQAIYFVLSEQRRQEEEMVNDPCSLAGIYCRISSQCALRAQDIAAVDAFEAQGIHQAGALGDEDSLVEDILDCWLFSPAKWFKSVHHGSIHL